MTNRERSVCVNEPSCISAYTGLVDYGGQAVQEVLTVPRSSITMSRCFAGSSKLLRALSPLQSAVKAKQKILFIITPEAQVATFPRSFYPSSPTQQPRTIKHTGLSSMCCLCWIHFAHNAAIPALFWLISLARVWTTLLACLHRGLQRSEVCLQPKLVLGQEGDTIPADLALHTSLQ